MRWLRTLAVFIVGVLAGVLLARFHSQGPRDGGPPYAPSFGGQAPWRGAEGPAQIPAEEGNPTPTVEGPFAQTPKQNDLESAGEEIAEATPPAIADFVDDQRLCAPNLKRHSALLTAGVQWAVEHGWCLRVVKAKHIKMPREYRQATNRYAGQVKLIRDGLALEGYVGGLPFPHINAGDSTAALKIMWNFYYGFVATDDATAHKLELRTGRIELEHPLTVERRTVVDAYRRLNYNGRLFVDPKPQLRNPDGVWFKESWHPVLEPHDRKNIGVTAYRYLDPERQDDTWLYPPELRRVRRLSAAQRSNALPISDPDIDLDSWWGFDAAIGLMDFKLLGESTILASLHARNVPPKWQEPEDWLFDDVWEPRRVWVIEATSKLPQYTYGKRVLFVDQEAWMIATSDIYDRSGQLWNAGVNMISFPPNADGVGAIHAAIMLAVQLGHVTALSIPGAEFADHEGWSLNMGEKSGVTEEFFSIAALIRGM